MAFASTMFELKKGPIPLISSATTWAHTKNVSQGFPVRLYFASPEDVDVCLSVEGSTGVLIPVKTNKEVPFKMMKRSDSLYIASPTTKGVSIVVVADNQ